MYANTNLATKLKNTYKEAINEIRESIIERRCETCKEYAINSDCDDCTIGEITHIIDELQLSDKEPA